MSRQISPFSDDDDEPTGLPEEVTQQIREHLAAVQILSLPSTRMVAEAAFARYSEADLATWASGAEAESFPAEYHEEFRVTAKGAIADLRTATALYLNFLRKEIGTDEGA